MTGSFQSKQPLSSAPHPDRSRSWQFRPDIAKYLREPEIDLELMHHESKIKTGVVLIAGIHTAPISADDLTVAC
jgi:hypothetical protein